MTVAAGRPTEVSLTGLVPDSAYTYLPGFHVRMSEDFSVDSLRTVTRETVTERYRLQRPWLGLVLVGCARSCLDGPDELAFSYQVR